MSGAGAQREAAGVLERERELDRIGNALTDATAGAGGVLLIEGPAGIGKTTLTRAAVTEARAREVRVVLGVGRELEREFPYGLVRQLFDPVLRSAEQDVRARLLDGAAGAAAALGLPAEGVGSEFATLHGLYWLVANLSDESPVLLVVDDVHWADRASARFLAFLVPRLRELPVLLVMCARPEEWETAELFAGTASDAAADALLPQPLSLEACAALTESRFGQPVNVAFGAACHTASGGNPFLLSELLDDLVADGTSPTAANLDGVLALGPRVVTRSIVTRLGRMPAAARPVATAIAVLGDGSSIQEVASLTGLSAADTRDAIEVLERASILGDGLGFAHPVIRNAVHQDLAVGDRERLHREAAAQLQAAGASSERIAAHLLAIEPAGEEWVCSALRVAAGSALRTGASHSAVAYLRRALAEPCLESDRMELLVELGEAERLVDGRAAVAHLREALELATDPARYVELATRLAWVLSFGMRTAEAVTTAELALSRLGDEERDLRRRLEATIILAGGHDPSHAQARKRILAQLGDVQHEEGLGARQVQAQLLVEQLGGDASADEIAAQAERLLTDGLLLREDNGAAGFIVAVQMLLRADSELAMVWLDRGVERARREGDGYALAGDLHFRCGAHLRRGELAEAVLDGTEALAAFEQWGVTGPPRVWSAGVLAQAQVEAGDLNGAERTLSRVAPPDGQVPDGRGWDAFMRSRASLLLARADPRGSLELTLEYARRGEPRSRQWVGWRSAAALCLLALGEQPQRALALVEEELELARRRGAPGALGAALRAHGLVHGDPTGEGSLREAVSVLAGSICKLEHARALVELGAMLRRTGRRREAREPLRDGLELARICGAVPLLRRAEEELGAAGASPRGATRASFDALTTSERRVAEMAASGMSNKQIAQALFVTVKTVETHLHRSYQKLGVSSRMQLARALEAHP